MSFFAVRVLGRGFFVPLQNARPARGFYVTVFIEAADEFDACDTALRLIVEDPGFIERIGPYADPDTAEIFSDYWFELASFEGRELPRTPYIFYEDDATVPTPGIQ